MITVEDNAPYSKQSTYTDDFSTRSNYDPNSEVKGYWLIDWKNWFLWFLNILISKGIRYKLTEQIVTKKLLEKMRQEENFENDYFDEPTNFVSEAHEKFSIPGFVSQPPKPITVYINFIKIY